MRSTPQTLLGPALETSKRLRLARRRFAGLWALLAVSCGPQAVSPAGSGEVFQSADAPTPNVFAEVAHYQGNTMWTVLNLQDGHTQFVLESAAESAQTAIREAARAGASLADQQIAGLAAAMQEVKSFQFNTVYEPSVGQAMRYQMLFKDGQTVVLNVSRASDMGCAMCADISTLTRASLSTQNVVLSDGSSVLSNVDTLVFGYQKVIEGEERTVYHAVLVKQGAGDLGSSVVIDMSGRASNVTVYSGAELGQLYRGAEPITNLVKADLPEQYLRVLTAPATRSPDTALTKLIIDTTDHLTPAVTPARTILSSALVSRALSVLGFVGNVAYVYQGTRDTVALMASTANDVAFALAPMYYGKFPVPTTSTPAPNYPGLNAYLSSIGANTRTVLSDGKNVWYPIGNQHLSVTLNTDGTYNVFLPNGIKVTVNQHGTPVYDVGAAFSVDVYDCSDPNAVMGPDGNCYGGKPDQAPCTGLACSSDLGGSGCDDVTCGGIIPNPGFGHGPCDYGSPFCASDNTPYDPGPNNPPGPTGGEFCTGLVYDCPPIFVPNQTRPVPAVTPGWTAGTFLAAGIPLPSMQPLRRSTWRGDIVTSAEFARAHFADGTGNSSKGGICITYAASASPQLDRPPPAGQRRMYNQFEVDKASYFDPSPIEVGTVHGDGSFVPGVVQCTYGVTDPKGNLVYYETPIENLRTLYFQAQYDIPAYAPGDCRAFARRGEKLFHSPSACTAYDQYPRGAPYVTEPLLLGEPARLRVIAVTPVGDTFARVKLGVDYSNASAGAEVRVGSIDGPVVGSFASDYVSSTAPAGTLSIDDGWVTDGMLFHLIDKRTGARMASAAVRFHPETFQAPLPSVVFSATASNGASCVPVNGHCVISVAPDDVITFSYVTRNVEVLSSYLDVSNGRDIYNNLTGPVPYFNKPQGDSFAGTILAGQAGRVYTFSLTGVNASGDAVQASMAIVVSGALVVGPSMPQVNFSINGCIPVNNECTVSVGLGDSVLYVWSSIDVERIEGQLEVSNAPDGLGNKSGPVPFFDCSPAGRCSGQLPASGIGSKVTAQMLGHDYTFTLKGTSASGQTAFAKATLRVR